jgi:phosphotransferase system  glucose/maltose/N-acetylglucosamine-specific IIC component
LPLILGSFSLAGIFAGIVLRVRGMTLMGSVFLLLSIVTMIWYASSNFGWTWLWYVFGIVTGAAIILTFAVFEKKKHLATKGT